VNCWLIAKVLGLLLYIILGMVALHYGKTKGVRVLAWLSAWLVFIYIVGVAVLKTPWSWF
jgi:uncharacterized membrane protein SirB2